MASKYKIDITRAAEKQLRRIPRADQERIAAALRSLAHDPRPAGVRKLSGWDNAYRIRVGQYRIIYDIDDKKITVLVLKIGNRKDVYQ